MDIKANKTLGMASLAASTLNGVKIYNLASGKTLPQWQAEKTKRALSKDEDYRKRVELLQDFHFPSGSQRLKMSGDGNYIVGTGMYPPVVKVFDVRDLSLKFERRLDAEVVQFEILSQDFGKLAFLQTDRSIVFHAPYGSHYSLRVPKFGRDMCYQRENCDMYIGASGPEVYRLNLDQGRFLAPLATSSTGVNTVKLNPVHQLLGLGCEDGIVECWDTRSQERVGLLDSIADAVHPNGPPSNFEITAMEFDRDGLTFGVGTSDGNCLLYDLRSSKPLLHKSHQYGLPIVDIKFHSTSNNVISSDSKVLKMWDRDTGDIFTNVETPAEVRDVCVVGAGTQSQEQSGVVLVAGEQERVMSYYVPELGVAPKWCSFLDSITEELEEEAQATVYDDYKFVTRQELASFGLEHLIGTALLRAYMHGFFMDARLYNKVKAIANPFAYEDYRKKKMQEKLEAKHANRITIQRRLPKVNRATAERLIKSKNKKDEEQVPEDDTLANPLGDDRFSRMFTSKEFEVDEDSAEYRRLHPNAGKEKKQNEDMDSDGAEDDEEEEEEEEAGRFDLVSDAEEEDVSSSEDEAPEHKKPKFYELAKGEQVDDLTEFGTARDRAEQKEKKKLAKIPLAERVRMEREQGGHETSSFRKDNAEGYVREMSFIPKSDRQKQDGQDNSQRRKKRGVGELGLKKQGKSRRFRK